MKPIGQNLIVIKQEKPQTNKPLILSSKRELRLYYVVSVGGDVKEVKPGDYVHIFEDMPVECMFESHPEYLMVNEGRVIAIANVDSATNREKE